MSLTIVTAHMFVEITVSREGCGARQAVFSAEARHSILAAHISCNWGLAPLAKTVKTTPGRMCPLRSAGRHTQY